MRATPLCNESPVAKTSSLLPVAQLILTLEEEIPDEEGQEHQQGDDSNGHTLHLFWHGLVYLLCGVLHLIGSALHTLADSAICRGGVLDLRGSQAGSRRCGVRDGRGSLLDRFDSGLLLGFGAFQPIIRRRR